MNATQLCSHDGNTRQRVLASMTAVVHAPWRGPVPAGPMADRQARRGAMLAASWSSEAQGGDVMEVLV